MRPVTTAYHLAQVNVGRLSAPLDSEQIRPFMELLAPINAIADVAPGFVWRLQTEAGDATGVRIDPDPQLAINLSVWESREALWDYVYRSPHLEVLRRRREWFDRHAEMHMAMWWVEAGTLPTVDEALARVDHVRAHGPTPHAFTFKQAYEADGTPVERPRAAAG